MESQSTGKYFWLILIFPLLLCLLNLRFLWLQCWNPTDTSNPESLAVYFAERVANHETLFLDYHKPPYNVLQYTPVYHLILGKTAAIFGLKREEIFVAGRLLTFGCTILIGLFLFLKTRSEEKQIPLAVSGAIFFLASYVLWPWAVTNRSDMLGVLFSLAGFLLYSYFPDKPARWFAILLFILAFFTKQYFLSAPFSIFLWMITERKWKQAIVMAFSFALPVILILVVMHWRTQHGRAHGISKFAADYIVIPSIDALACSACYRWRSK
jgi:hypothetical protein